MIVVDASVAVKWFFPEPGAESAGAILSGSEKLMAPALIRVEAAAEITRKFRTGELAAEEAASACRLWFAALARGVITLSPDEVDLAAAMELAIQIRHPLQDCLYLAVARRAHCALITADLKFGARARDVYEEVKLLS